MLIEDEEFFYDVGSTRRKKVFFFGRTNQWDLRIMQQL